MAGSGDETAASAEGRGYLRASHADREQVVDTLKAAFVQGMLTKDEFDLRVGQTFASRTHADLAAVTSDIPPGLPTARPPAPAVARAEQRVARPGPVMAAATGLYAGVWAYVAHVPEAGNHATAALILGSGLIWFMVLLICMGQMVALRREKRSGRQPPQRNHGIRYPSVCHQLPHHQPATDETLGRGEPVEGITAVPKVGDVHCARAALAHKYFLVRFAAPQ
jgi:hypothetical protein